MKIGVYISPAYAVPPKGHHILAPWIIVGQLADGFVDHGHKVYLFAAKESKTNAILCHNDIESTSRYRQGMSKNDYHNFVIEAERKLCKFMFDIAVKENLDIVHIHVPIERLYPVLTTKPPNIPLVFTFHDPITNNRNRDLTKISQLKNVYFVSLSQNQRNDATINFINTVPNGIDPKLYTMRNGSQKYLLITGRIRLEKGFTDAIEVSKITGEKLIITGEHFDYPINNRKYWEKKVKPAIDNKKIFYIGLESMSHLVKLYQESIAFLFPIHWEEPFGLVMIEAMACGTPVIAYNRGSVPEIIKDGVTGFIIDPPLADQEIRNSKFKIRNSGRWVIKKRGIEGMVEAVRRIGEIDRANCRRHVEENFTIEKMVEGYENVYKKILNIKN